MRVRNLTPHPVHLQAPDGAEVTIPPEGVVPRVRETSAPAGAVDVEGTAIPVVSVRRVGVVGLPEPEPGVLLIVSSLVAEAAGRDDLVVPYDLIRDDQGRVVGARALARVR